MEAFIGTITLFAGDYAPDGWLVCDGKELPIAQYQALFSILGNQYGGNGTTHFALPNLTPLPDLDGKGESIYIVCVEGIYPTRD